MHALMPFERKIEILRKEDPVLSIDRNREDLNPYRYESLRAHQIRSRVRILKSSTHSAVSRFRCLGLIFF